MKTKTLETENGKISDENKKLNGRIIFLEEDYITSENETFKSVYLRIRDIHLE